MEKGMLSWLINNHIQSETKLDQVFGPLIYLAQKNDDIKVESANTAFEDLLTGMITIGSMGCI